MTAAVPVEPVAQAAPNARSSQRSNMFLGAALQGESFCAPVKVRNMSASGALAEGSALPEAGARVSLVRGVLSVPSRVVWSANGRCGLEFAASVMISDWMAPLKNREQQRVDAVVGLVKQGTAPAAVPESMPPPAGRAHLGEELRRVCALLQNTGEGLSRDKIAVARHGTELQSLDISIQTIGAVADALRGDCPQSAQQLANLRLSIEQALGAGRFHPDLD